jgi:hypothetical protein
MYINYCSCFFSPPYAYVVDNLSDDPIEKINIYDYLKNKTLQDQIKKKEKLLVCSKKNELSKYESEKKESFFRHKTAKYMTEWHKNWQKQFELTEISIGNCRADAIINNIVLEFQHSEINSESVTTRQQNYINHNKELYWIIDCDDKSVIIKEIGSIYMIHFRNNYWKYQSFKSHEFIFLHKDKMIYKINPNDVKSHMLDVSEQVYEFYFIECLKKNTQNTLWSIQSYPQSILYYNQRGAGCGKTYESIQLLNSDKFLNKSCFIYLTKMHSAREVICYELTDQYKSKKLNNLQFIEINGKFINQYGKQYVIQYTNLLNDSKCEIIIGTVDSFMYTLGRVYVEKNSNDYFGSMVKQIRDGNMNIHHDGSIKYANSNVKINGQTLILIDETQDLEPTYVEALCSIIRSTNSDAFIIGDKLQSIMNEINVYTFLENNELPNITIIKNTGENCVRRFHNSNFIDFVNDIVPFEKFELPKITNICDIGNCKYRHETHIPYKFIKTEKKNSSNTDDLSVNCDTITRLIDDEVERYGYLPKNFMLIFPILKSNVLANMLETKIQDYWLSKFMDKKYQNDVLKNDQFWSTKIDNINLSYNKFIFLHKSEENKPINLKESENATKIMSIHASKGNGCEVVFLLNMEERSLKRFSNNKINIIYESLLHVALTRQKISLYIGYSDNDDEISERFIKYNNGSTYTIKPDLSNIKLSNPFESIIKDMYSIDKNVVNLLSRCNNLDIIKNLTNQSDTDITNKKHIIDWGHHVLRYYVFEYYFNFYLSEYLIQTHDQKTENELLNQFTAKLNSFRTKNVQMYKYKEYYKQLKEIDNANKDHKYEKNKIIPILQFENSDNTKNKKYTESIIKIIKNIQFKMTKNLKSKCLCELCPLEVIVLYYCLEIIDNAMYTNISIMDLYSIIYIYDECSSEIPLTHDLYKCKCKEVFTDNNNNISCSYTEIRASINNHYENTKKIKDIFANFKTVFEDKYEQLNKFNLHTNVSITFNGKTNGFKIWGRYGLIGNSEKYTFLKILKPQLNILNINQTIFEIIYDIYLISNSKDDQKNYERYNNKQIIVCLFTLETDEPIIFSINIDKQTLNEISNCVKNQLLDHYKKLHSKIIKFHEFCKINNFDTYQIYDDGKCSINNPKYIGNILSSLSDGLIDDDELELHLDKKLDKEINNYFGQDGTINDFKIINDYNIINININNINDENTHIYDQINDYKILSDDILDDNILIDDRIVDNIINNTRLIIS